MNPPCVIRPEQFHVVKWFSSSEATAAQTNAHIADAVTGYLAELLTLGQANAAIGSPGLVGPPYSTRLRPLCTLDFIRRADRVYLKKLQFQIYDTTFWDGANAGAGQDDAVVSEIETSTSTATDSYAASKFRNAHPPPWVPNFFRPAFIVNGKNVLGSVGVTAFGNGQNAGDLSNGLPLYCCFDFSSILMDLDRVRELEVYAQAAQFVTGEAKWQRYPVECIAEFILGAPEYR